MALKYKNNAFGTLSAGISNSATSIPLTGGHGARFPTLGAQDYFYATLVDASGNLEIVLVTGRATDTLTVVRGQDGTTGLAYNAGDRIEMRPNIAAIQAGAQEAATAVVTSGTDVYTATLAPAPKALNTDQIYYVRIGNANLTTTPTINFNSLGAVNVVKVNGALAVGDLVAGMLAILHFNGTNLVLLNPPLVSAPVDYTVSTLLFI